MSNDNVPETPVASDQTAMRRAAPKLSPRQAALAEQRRAAFARFLDERDLRPAGLARLAGLPSANAIYKFYQRRQRLAVTDHDRKDPRGNAGSHADRLDGPIPSWSGDGHQSWFPGAARRRL